MKSVPRARPAPLPRREVFPTPTPLTSEERALLALVAKSPELARELLTPTEPKPIEPIIIEPINIEPPVMADNAKERNAHEKDDVESDARGDAGRGRAVGTGR